MSLPMPKHPSEDGCLGLSRGARRWHGFYCRWYDHHHAGHRLRARLWGAAADAACRLA